MPYIHSFIYSPIRSFIYLLLHVYVFYSFIHLSIHMFIYSLIHSFLQSPIQDFSQKVFTNSLLCGRYMSRSWNAELNKTDAYLCLQGAYL